MPRWWRTGRQTVSSGLAASGIASRLMLRTMGSAVGDGHESPAASRGRPRQLAAAELAGAQREQRGERRSRVERVGDRLAAGDRQGGAQLATHLGDEDVTGGSGTGVE